MLKMLKLIGNKAFGVKLFQTINQNSLNFCTAADLTKAIPRDINEIIVMGRVTSKCLYNTKNFSTFLMTTHFNTRNENNVELEHQTNHPIMVLDPDLRKHATDIVKMGKRLMVYGQIEYWRTKSDKGMHAHSATITAKRIVEVQQID